MQIPAMISVFMTCCLAQDLLCNVTQGLQETLYSVPFPGDTHSKADCEFYWTNSSGHVLANHRSFTNPVVNRSHSFLRSKTCHTQINYTRNCVSEGIEHTGVCKTDCVIPPEGQKSEGIPRHRWFLLMTACLMVLAFLWLACRHFKKKKSNSNTCDVQMQV